MAEPEPLQFERAEFDRAPTVACAQCATPLSSYYYDVNGQTVCERCRYAIEATMTSGSASGRFFLALGAGFGAALLGSLLYYAVVALSGYEIGLIAIAVGYGVGTAVRWGSGGRGGRGYQFLAVALTYMAIVSTYIPPIIKGLSENRREGIEASASEVTRVESAAPATATATSPTPSPAPTPTQAQTSTTGPTQPPARQVGPVAIVIGIAFLLALAAAAPFLAGVQNVIGLFIIAIGLWEAWKLNRRTEIVISGPHALAPPAVQTADA
jgi:hypothetical protein